MRVAVEKIEGVSAVEVSLERGLATIRLKPQNQVTMEKLWEAIRDNGFTLKAAEVRISGTLVREGGRLMLSVPGHETAYALEDNPEAPGVAAGLSDAPSDRMLTVEGRVPAPVKGSDRANVIQVRSISLRAP